MQIRKLIPTDKEFPEAFTQLPQPPKAIYVAGADLNSLLASPSVSIVGARKASVYGQAITKQFASELAQYGIVIVSGLALGIDSTGHKASIDASGKTIAILPSPLQKVYPASHYHLAMEILKKGGALISEYPEGTDVRNENFIARNRLIAALSQGTLITEAALKSGSLHTARFALEQGKTVMAVPGNITSYLSEGTNNLIKAGAVPVTNINDILTALNLKKVNGQQAFALGSMEEQQIVDLLKAGVNDTSEIIKQSGLSTEKFNQALTMLEINGVVRSLGGGQWSLV